MAQNYDVRQAQDGTYAVIDIATGKPVVINDVEQVGLDIQNADEIAESLDNIDYFTRGRGSTAMN